MYCMLGMFDYRDWCREIDRIVACGYIDTTYVSRIKRVCKKLLKMINSKARTVKRLQRARESHRKQREVEESEQDL